jgi:beta-lactamase class A
MKNFQRFIAFATVTFALAISTIAQSSASLDSRVKQEIARFKGRVSLFAKNLDTGASYGLSEDERVPTASTIKVAIMVEAFAQVSEGRVRWTDAVTLTKASKVGGSGVLKELSDGLRLTLRDAVTLMIILSDNTATNLALDLLTCDAVNARMEAMGFRNTRALRKVFGGGVSRAGEDAANKPFGLGVTTPREMVALLEKLHRGEVVSAQASKEMIDLLKRQPSREGIGRNLRNTETAAKPGALDRLRSDVGIIYSARGRIAIAITCNDIAEVDWTADNPAYHLMSRLSEILIDGLGK